MNMYIEKAIKIKAWYYPTHRLYYNYYMNNKKLLPYSLKWKTNLDLNKKKSRIRNH